MKWFKGRPKVEELESKEGSRALVELRGLELRHGRRVILSDVDLDLEEGTCTALLGRNGAGKSTLLHHLMGLAPRHRGRVRVPEADPRQRPSLVHRDVGCAPQGAELPGRVRLGRYLNWLSATHPKFDGRSAERLMDRFAMDARLRWREASRGQRALWVLVSALSIRPALLLLDEPFDGLDPFARRAAVDSLLDYLANDRGTVLFAGHTLQEVQVLADRVLWIEGRGIGFDGSLDELQRTTARVRVGLVDPSVEWVPPGQPLVESRDGDVVLTYLDWSPERRAELESDRGVASVDLLSRELSDLLIARTNPEVSLCAAS